MTDRVSIPRLRSVTDKRTGRSVTVLRPRGTTNRDDLNNAVAECVASLDGAILGGYALVVWDMTGRSASNCYAGPIPRSLLPQFIKDRLLLHTAQQWINPVDYTGGEGA